MFGILVYIVFLCECCCVFLTDIAYGQTVPSISCPQHFRYEQCELHICGLITLPPLITNSLEINVGFSLPKFIQTSEWGLLTPLSEINLRHGKAMQYRVTFPVQDPIPKLTSLLVNEKEIIDCKASQYPIPNSNFRLFHTLRDQTPLMFTNNRKTSNTFNVNQNRESDPMVTYITDPKTSLETNIGSILENVFREDRSNSQDSFIRLEPTTNVNTSPIFRSPTFVQQTTSIPLMPSTPHIALPAVNIQHHTSNLQNVFNNNNNNIDISDCGIEGTESGITPYIHNGDLFPRGRFPWLAVIYRKDITGLNFTCGGTIVSKRSVITAAHCFMIHKYTANKIIVYLGRHDLESYTDEGLQTRDVQTLLPHPDFSTSVMADADIALIQLREPIEYNAYVRPICIWNESVDINIIVGLKGTVAGWGADETGQAVSTLPKKDDATIVSSNTCSASNKAFKRLLSDRSFCAGDLDDSGPCQGDSGGGLMLKRKNRWTLRGIVSAGVIDAVGRRCNLRQYVSYCDVAKHREWVLENVIN